MSDKAVSIKSYAHVLVQTSRPSDLTLPLSYYTQTPRGSSDERPAVIVHGSWLRTASFDERFGCCLVIFDLPCIFLAPAVCVAHLHFMTHTEWYKLASTCPTQSGVSGLIINNTLNIMSSEPSRARDLQAISHRCVQMCTHVLLQMAYAWIYCDTGCTM